MILKKDISYIVCDAIVRTFASWLENSLYFVYKSFRESQDQAGRIDLRKLPETS